MLHEYSSDSIYLPPADIVTGSIVPTFTELSLLTNILILETSSERDVIEIYVHNTVHPRLSKSRLSECKISQATATFTKAM